MGFIATPYQQPLALFQPFYPLRKHFVLKSVLNCFLIMSVVVKLQLLPSMLPDKLLMDSKNSGGFFSTYEVLSFSDSFYKSTADKSSSVNYYLLSFLTFILLVQYMQAHELTCTFYTCIQLPHVLFYI